MATGDKLFLQMMNKDTISVRLNGSSETEIFYGSGSVVVKDDKIYQANADIASGTAWTESDSGATWKQINTFDGYSAWTGSTAYEAGDLRIYEGSLYAAKAVIADSVTAFSHDDWAPVIYGLMDPSVFDVLDITSTNDASSSAKALAPKTLQGLELGTADKCVGAMYTERVRFHDTAGTYKGEIDVDSGNFEIASNQEIRLKGEGATSTVLEVRSTEVELPQAGTSLIFNDNSYARFRDSDTSGQEYWDIGVATDTNDLRIVSWGDDGVDFLDDRMRPIGDNAMHLGDTGHRWTRLYAANSSIATSDARLKTVHKTVLDDEFLDAWEKNCRPCEWSWKAEGDEGLKHIGWLAQDVVQAFTDAGMDWREYDLVHEDEEGILSICKEECQAVENVVIRRKIGL